MPSRHLQRPSKICTPTSIPPAFRLLQSKSCALEELDLRGIGRGDCVERSELIDALCGQASADEADEGGDLVPPSPVDKMV